MHMNSSEYPRALFKVRYRHNDDHEGTYREVIVDNMTQVNNMREIHRVVHVDVAVPYWAPLDNY